MLDVPERNPQPEGEDSRHEHDPRRLAQGWHRRLSEVSGTRTFVNLVLQFGAILPSRPSSHTVGWNRPPMSTVIQRGNVALTTLGRQRGWGCSRSDMTTRDVPDRHRRSRDLLRLRHVRCVPRAGARRPSRESGAREVANMGFDDVSARSSACARTIRRSPRPRWQRSARPRARFTAAEWGVTGSSNASGMCSEDSPDDEARARAALVALEHPWPGGPCTRSDVVAMPDPGRGSAPRNSWPTGTTRPTNVSPGRRHTSPTTTRHTRPTATWRRTSRFALHSPLSARGG